MHDESFTYDKTVKEAIIQTVVELVMKTELGRLSVSEIAKAAGVSRSSFYRNFDSKEQPLVVYIQERYREYFESEISALAHGEAPALDVFLLKRFRFVKENAEFFTALKRNNLLEYVFEHMEPDLNHFLSGNISGRSPYYRALFTGACAGVIRCWIDRRFKESPEEMLALFTNGIQDAAQ